MNALNNAQTEEKTLAPLGLVRQRWVQFKDDGVSQCSRRCPEEETVEERVWVAGETDMNSETVSSSDQTCVLSFLSGRSSDEERDESQSSEVVRTWKQLIDEMTAGLRAIEEEVVGRQLRHSGSRAGGWAGAQS